MKTLYIFLDESGNFDFSPSGTKYFILTALSTTLPFEIGSPLLKHRYDLLPNYAIRQSTLLVGQFIESGIQRTYDPLSS